jgi:YHS domain-containing protein
MTLRRLFALFFACAALPLSAPAGTPSNKVCPVDGKAVDATKVSDLSVSIGTCCAKCQGKFEADPAAQAKAVKKYVGNTDSPANKKCVINASKDVADGNVSTAKLTVGFCCDKCKEAFDKDPKKYIAKVK